MAFPHNSLLVRLHSETESFQTAGWARYLPKDFSAARGEKKGRGIIGRSFSDVSTAASSDGSEVSPSLGDQGDVARASVRNNRETAVWDLAKDADGCWEVQRLLEDAPSSAARLAIAMQFRGHIWEAIQCPQANHVVQKVIKILPQTDVQFIVDEVHAIGPVVVSQCKFGCRILKNLLEYCSEAQIEKLVPAVLDNFLETATHCFGNFVVQHMFQHLTGDSRLQLTELIVHNASQLAADAYGSGVVAAMLVDEATTCEEVVALATAVLAKPESLVQMATFRFGHRAVQDLMVHLQNHPSSLRAAQKVLNLHEDQLRAVRYGRTVLRFLHSEGLL